MPKFQLPPVRLLALADEAHRRKHQPFRHLPHHQVQHDRHRHEGDAAENCRGEEGEAHGVTFRRASPTAKWLIARAAADEVFG